MRKQPKILAACLAALATAVALPLVAAPGDKPAPADYFRAAPLLGNPEKAPIYAAGLADKRVVAVGDYGLVIVSDDGKSFRQAKVPTRAPFQRLLHRWQAGLGGRPRRHHPGHRRRR